MTGTFKSKSLYDDGLELPLVSVLLSRSIYLGVFSLVGSLALAAFGLLVFAAASPQSVTLAAVMVFLLSCWCIFASIFMASCDTRKAGVLFWPSMAGPSVILSYSIARAVVVALGPLLVMVFLALFSSGLDLASAAIYWLGMLGVSLAFSAFISCWRVASVGALLGLIAATLVILIPVVCGCDYQQYLGKLFNNAAVTASSDVAAGISDAPQTQPADSDHDTDVSEATGSDARAASQEPALSPAEKRWRQMQNVSQTIMRDSPITAPLMLPVWLLVAIVANGYCALRAHRRIVKFGI